MATQKQAAAMAAKSKSPVESMRIEPSDNGGFVSHTSMKAPPRKPGGPYVDRPDPDTVVHPNVEHLAAHVKATLGPKDGKKAAAAKSAWGGVATQMLSGGVSSPKSANGAR